MTAGECDGKEHDRAARRRKPDTVLGRALRERFARNVRELRMERGLSQVKLAKAAGIARSFLNQIELGRFSASLETMGAIAGALGVCPSRLIEPCDQGARPPTAAASTGDELDGAQRSMTPG